MNLFFDVHIKKLFSEIFSAGRRRLIANGKRVANRGGMKSSVNTHNCDKISASWHAHWPVFIALVFTFLGWIFYHAEGSYIVNVVGAVGFAICLPLFKLEKKWWLYGAAFLLPVVNEIGPGDARPIADYLGLEWLPSKVASLVFTATQGALISFVVLLLLYLFIFRGQGGPAILVRVPITIFFLLAALTPAFVLIWLILGLTGLFGPL